MKFFWNFLFLGFFYFWRELPERSMTKETLLLKEEVPDDAEVFGEVVVDVEGSQKGPF